jgi:hypothetical protein
MSKQTWIEVLTAMEVAGSALNNYTTAVTVLPPQNLYTFPANYFETGKLLRITVMGSISNIVTTPGTIVFQVIIGGVVVFTTGNIQLNATAHTTLPFTLEILLTCRAVGNGTLANFLGMARLNGVMFTKTAGQTDGANSETIIQAPVTAPAVGTGFNSTIAAILDFFVGFSIANAGNQIQVQQYVVEALN